MNAPRTPIVRAVLLVAGIFATGTVGYRVLENASWWDAFFMTVITITTVGYEEEVPLSRGGEIFTSLLILAGLGVVAVQRKTGVFANPEPEFKLESGDVLVVFGRRDQISEFESQCG